MKKEVTAYWNLREAAEVVLSRRYSREKRTSQVINVSFQFQKLEKKSKLKAKQTEGGK